MPNSLYILIAFAAAAIIVAWYLLRQWYQSSPVHQTIDNRVVLKIAVPRGNDKSPLAAEQLFAALHGLRLNKPQALDHFGLEIAAGSFGIYFICVVAREYRIFLENQIYAQYPEAQISEIGDPAPSLGHKPHTITQLRLAGETVLPIRTFPNFDVDPLAAITSAISNLGPQDQVFIQILARAVQNKNQNLNPNSDKLNSEQQKLAERKLSKVGFQVSIRVLAESSSLGAAQRLNRETVAAFGQYATAITNSLQPLKASKFSLTQWLTGLLWGKRPEQRLPLLSQFQERFLAHNAKDIFNTEELASLFHLPNKSVETAGIAWVKSRQLEPPLDLPTKDVRILGVTDYRNIKQPFGILAPDRLRHMYVIGKTGVGKSTFMEGMVMSDIYAGQGVAVIDPHGETIQHILAHIPKQRLQDVVVLDPGDTEYPVGFNLLEISPGEDKSLVADGIVGVFKKEWKDSWGPRLEYILTNAVLTLLSCQNVSLLVLPRLLQDDNYRKFMLKQLKNDPILLKFWEHEYAEIAKDPRRKSEEISSILNKVGRFTTSPLIRNVVGQVSGSINLHQLMDEGKILLINLSQGKIGEENMSLLGGMLITRLYATATQRKHPNKPFYLYVDEFQNFATPTFVKILSEARKYGLGLTVAHQFIDQLEPDIRNAIFGNVGSLINFAVGPRDADFLIKEYAPYLDAEDLVNLGRFKIVTKLSVAGAQSRPFTGITLQPNFPPTGLTEQILEFSRHTYAKPRAVMEQKINKWAEGEYDAKGNLKQ